MMHKKDGKENMYKVSLLLGHSSTKTTETFYVDLLDSNLRDAVEEINYDED
ncbi:hypothetical protein ACFL6E_07210 [Candidatus Neomarinimicrobiota bacterium]